MNYENHMLENKQLPFIFHYDTIRMTEEREYNAFGNWHENPEFLYFTKGSGQVVNNRHNYAVGPGDMAVINSDCFHAVCSDRELEYYCLIVDTGFFRDNGIAIDTVVYENIIKDKKYAKFFKKLMILYTQKEGCYCAKIRAAVLEFLIDLTENHVETEVAGDNFPESIKDAVGFIKKNYSENITIDDIVRHAGFSRAYFSRMFKNNTGVSIITYLNYIRCSQARVLLVRDKLTAGQVSEMCGFNNYSYFSRTYKSIMGILPSEEMKLVSQDVPDEEELICGTDPAFHLVRFG